jgi:ferritin-like metal-binding protein YciE
MAEHFDDLRDLLSHELKDLYDAEHQLIEALPKMAEDATDQTLKQAFTSHLTETKEHVKRLESVFALLDVKADRETCKAMKGLIKEGKEALKAKGDPAVNDLALIAAAQRVEHYEMAGYGSVRTMCEIIGNQQAADQLQKTLDEEGAADHKLTDIAKSIYQVAR